MQDQETNSLIDPMGDCTQCLLNLVILGRATPYLHNGELTLEVEETGEVKMNKAKYFIQKNKTKKYQNVYKKITNDWMIAKWMLILGTLLEHVLKVTPSSQVTLEWLFT